MAWDGDISRIGKLAQRIADLVRVPSQASTMASQGIKNLIEHEFDAGEDPYGKKWAPLAPSTVAKPRFPPPLTDTGALRSSVDVRAVQDAGVQITVSPLAAPHQTGWVGPISTGPARPILPDRSMPDTWREVISAAVRECVTAALKK